MLWRQARQSDILTRMSEAEAKRAPSSGRGKFVVASLVCALVVSVVLRMLLADTHSTRSNPLLSGARSFASSVADDHPGEANTLARVLPFVTEASLFGLIGFALGYTTRKALKLALIAIALGFVALHVLVSMGKIDVDWSGIVQAIDRWILNMNFNASVPEFLKKRLPTMAVFAVSYFIGLRKG